MLKIDHLRKNYGSFALDCSLEVQPGCITGLIGQNGAGKAPLLRQSWADLHRRRQYPVFEKT